MVRRPSTERGTEGSTPGFPWSSRTSYFNTGTPVVTSSDDF